MPKPRPTTWFQIALLLGGRLLPLWPVGAGALAQTHLASPAPAGADALSEVSAPVRPRLNIASDSACPSGLAVAEALGALVPPADWPDGTVRIESAVDMLGVELISDGSTRRQLRVTADCGVRATTVALVIATWTGELASDAAGEPVLRGQDARSEAPVGIRPATPATPPVATSTERELGAGALLSFSGGIAPGVRIDFVTTRAPIGIGWQVGLALPAQRERIAGDVTSSWTRASANIAINGRISARRFAISAEAGLAGAYTFAWGHGYSIPQGQEALTAGLVAGARVALSWRRMRIWAGVRAYQWLFPQVIAVDSPAGDRVATEALPSFDLHCAMGLAYAFR